MEKTYAERLAEARDRRMSSKTPEQLDAYVDGLSDAKLAEIGARRDAERAVDESDPLNCDECGYPAADEGCAPGDCAEDREPEPDDFRYESPTGDHEPADEHPAPADEQPAPVNEVGATEA